MVQPDGKVIAVGWGLNVPVAQASDPGAAIYMSMARFNTNGTPDSSFGTNGKVTTLVGVEARAFAVALQPDGRIVVAGSGTDGATQNFAIVRYTTVAFPIRPLAQAVCSTFRSARRARPRKR